MARRPRPPVLRPPFPPWPALTSVRLRLLVLALAPLVVLMPLLLLIGMTRWTADYDKVLIANAESDLRIAQQYLSRIMTGTGEELDGVAGSVAFAEVLDTMAASDPGAGAAVGRAFFARKRAELGLDFLYYLPWEAAQAPAARWPVIARGLGGEADTRIDLFSPAELGAIDPDLAARARIPLIETEAAVPTTREAEDRGMVVHAASPVTRLGHEGVLVGGILLNRNLQFIDSINALVFLNAVTGGERQGTATLFLDDVRVSTNVRLFEEVRALGTRVSAVVREAVLGQGRTWLDRAFVVNDWYISGYLPLEDSFGTRVGMLYVGFLEAPFARAKRAAYLWMLAAFAGVLLISAPVFFRLARGIFAPLERMGRTMDRVGQGDLSARNGAAGTGDEIDQVAAHLDWLLDQVQDRDARLRAWAEELNQRVAARTAELSEANARLEETYRQLVMSEKLAAIGEITAGVAHEINNPVAVIQGNVDVIRDSLPPAATAEVATELDLIDRQVARIGAIVGKLLKFAGPGSMGEGGEAPPLDPAPVVEDCLLLVEHVIARAGVAVTLDLGPGRSPERASDWGSDRASGWGPDRSSDWAPGLGPERSADRSPELPPDGVPGRVPGGRVPDRAPVPPVRIDANELQQVVVNLVVNAVQAMERDDGQDRERDGDRDEAQNGAQNGTQNGAQDGVPGREQGRKQDGARPRRLALTLAEEVRDGVAGVVLSIADTGPGIPDESLGALFDPFFTTRRGEGTGLGLSISQSLIQRAGGLITAVSRPAGAPGHTPGSTEGHTSGHMEGHMEGHAPGATEDRRGAPAEGRAAGYAKDRAGGHVPEMAGPEMPGAEMPGPGATFRVWLPAAPTED